MPHSKDKPPSQEPRIYSPSEDELALLVRSGRIVAKYPKQSPERRGILSLSEARALISPELFRGPKEVERVFGFQPEVPPILFTRSELERAKELGQRLVLRSAKDGAGQPLSPARMQEILAPKWQDANQGVLDTPERWSNLIGPDRMSTETARGGWALVSPDLLPGTLSQNYFEQTDTLIAELKKTYQNIPLPDQYTKAIQEYEAQKDELLTLAGDDVTWQEATRRLSELAITQLLRANLSEDLFDLLVERGMTGTSPRQNMYNWTSSLSRDGSLVHVGDFDAEGVSGDDWRPHSAHDIVGASFSRLASPKL